MGDFNAILSPQDKNSGTPNTNDIKNAEYLLRDLHLVELPLQGRNFTWANGQADPWYTHGVYTAMHRSHK